MAEPTEEEIRAALEWYALQQQAQTNPIALTANQWGQGPDFLGEDKRPTTWSRAGDKDQILRDVMSMTDIDFPELVPGLYPMIQAPSAEDLQVSADPVLTLYQNDPLMARISAMVNDPVNPVSPTQAINALKVDYSNDPSQFDGMLPMTTTTQGRRTTSTPDWSGYESDAEKYLTAAIEQGSAQSEADRLQALYEDYVRPRTQYEMSGSPVYQDVRAQFAEKYGWDDPQLEFQELNPGARPEPAARVPLDLSLAEQATDRFGNPVSSPTRNPLAGARRQRQEDQARADAEAVRNSPNRPLVGGIRGRGENQYMGSSVVKRNKSEDAFKAGFDKAIEKSKTRQRASKKEENLARIIAAYNTHIYGQ